MFPYVIAASIGALLVGRTKPKTKVEKKTCLGPRSGITYEVEDFPTAGFLVVKAPDGSQGIFTRAPNSLGLQYVRGQGNPEVMRLMLADFQPLQKKDEGDANR